MHGFSRARRRRQKGSSQILEIFAHQEGVWGGLIDAFIEMRYCTVYQDLILYRNMFTIQSSLIIGAPRGEGSRHATVGCSHKWGV